MLTMPVTKDPRTKLSGGEQGRAALCRHTARSKPAWEKGLHKGGNASNLDLSLLILQFALAL
jgi:hypothetical protein